MINHSAAAKASTDDELFTRLLEAAYVIQERQSHIRQKLTLAEFPEIVSQVLETQRLIQTDQMGFQPALQLVASRLREFTGAAGIAIGRLRREQMEYLVANGSVAAVAGSLIPVSASPSFLCVKNGVPVKSYAVQSDFRSDLELCRKLGAESFLALPVFRESAVAGAVELFFSTTNAFDDVEVRVAELMAGVVTELMTQEAEHELKQELAAERASVLLALERLKPQLQKLAGEDRGDGNKTDAGVVSELCRACGHPFAGDELACMTCGASRATGKYPGAELQSKWAALWERQLVDVEHGPSFRKAPPIDGHANNGSDELPVLDLDVAGADLDEEGPATLDGDLEEELSPEPALVQDIESGRLVPITEISEHPEWQSAKAVKEWLKTQVEERSSIQKIRRMVATRGGDISLVLATTVLMVAIVWGLWPQATSKMNAAPAASVAARKHRPKPPELSLLDKLMVETGLAVPPPAPEYMGNPNTKVWVDLQTGLYYCPGTTLYGTSSKGKYTSQSDAQQDQFEPAARTPCD